jgi:hypothetical protein
MAADAIRKEVTTQLIRSGSTPNSADMMGMAIFSEVDKKGPIKLTRQIE